MSSAYTTIGAKGGMDITGASLLNLIQSGGQYTSTDVAFAAFKGDANSANFALSGGANLTNVAMQNTAGGPLLSGITHKDLRVLFNNCQGVLNSIAFGTLTTAGMSQLAQDRLKVICVWSKGSSNISGVWPCFLYRKLFLFDVIQPSSPVLCGLFGGAIRK